ncbi:hypothetical protein BH23PLA1_BH23PLA1_33340 [soil metagenome]
MRRLIFGLALTTGILAVAPAVQAQNPIGSADPFFLYYGYFLPRQQSIAAMQQAGSVAVLNSNSAARSFDAQARRFDQDQGLRPLGMDELDPSAPIGAGRMQAGRSTGPVFLSPGQVSSPYNSLYHNRTAGFYPGLRTGAPGTGGGGASAAGVAAPRPMPSPIGGFGGMGAMGGMGGFR